MTTSLRNNGIAWLASYPKSGNTWFRALLSNYLANRDECVPLDELKAPWGIARRTLDTLTGLDASLLLPEELQTLWPALNRQLAATMPAPRLLKTHAALMPANGFLDLQGSAGAIYLVRNPLAVCVSFAHHRASSIDDTIALMHNRQHSMRHSGHDWHPALTECVSSWRDHVTGWVDTNALPTQVIRYEDLLDDTASIFAEAVAFLGLDVDAGRIAQAVKLSTFERLQTQESSHGFREKGSRTARFFRQGKKDSWQEKLNRRQINALLNTNGEIMERFGYSTRLPATIA